MPPHLATPPCPAPPGPRDPAPTGFRATRHGKRLRIHRISNTEIYSLTWNLASPDGRATFYLDKMDDGEPLLVWRRIGDHTIYKNP